MTGDATNPVSVDDRKLALRTEMRAIRRALPDREERSASITEQLCRDPFVLSAARVMVFDSIASEPDTTAFVGWCQARGGETLMPEDDVAPSWPDVVIVPGVAFTPDGRRCGQGGGWYDRFLPSVRPDCRLIGVCFAPQLVDDLPTDAHDVSVHHVISA